MILNVKFLTIRFTHGGRGNWKHLKENLDEFLQEYEPGYWVIWLFKEWQYVASFHDFLQANAGASQTKCTWTSPPLDKHKSCEYNLEWLSDPRSDIKCISEEYYGYLFGKPCLLLKLNRLYGWYFKSPTRTERVRVQRYNLKWSSSVVNHCPFLEFK